MVFWPLDTLETVIEPVGPVVDVQKAAEAENAEALLAQSMALTLYQYWVPAFRLLSMKLACGGLAGGLPVTEPTTLQVALSRLREIS